MRRAHLTHALSAIAVTLLTLTVAPSMGQQIATPKTLPSATSATPAPSGAARTSVPATSFAAAGPATITPGTPAITTPGATTGAPQTYAPSTPGYVPPPGTYAPGATAAPGSTYVTPGGPTATLDGTIAPPPSFDPYSTSGAQTPPVYGVDPVYGDFPHQDGPVQQRLLQQIAFDYLWMAGSNSQLGINDLELSATFAMPFFYNTRTPLLVTPGFAIHYWNGPIAPSGDMPPQTYDAYLDLGWNPRVNAQLSGELGFRVGIYSDFDKVTQDSVRLQGRGLAVFTFSERFQVKFGAWYLDRNAVKILPAGGVVWTPNSDVRFEILFPNPKLAQRLTTWGTTEWWWYVSGAYGGGAWTIERDPAGTVGGVAFTDRVDYNDIRIALGLEFMAMSGMEGYFEIGLAFDREIYYVSRDAAAYYKPDSTVFLRAGVSY